MQKRRDLYISIVAGWIVSAVAIGLISIILIPVENRSEYFWIRVCWAEFLVLLCWGSTYFYIHISSISKDHVSRLGVIASSISIVSLAYAFLSLSAMLIHSYLPETDVGNRANLVVQIAMFSVATLSAVILAIARTGASIGLGYDKASAKSPRKLHDLLAFHETSLPADDGLKASIKLLRELLLFSFNETTTLADSQEYRSLSTEVLSFCASIEEFQKGSEENSNFSSVLTGTARNLATKARLVSSNLIQR